ncbi:uncharacterized protein SCHCODRAFT_02711534 [Schizophyllum commune H4-8]|uniref:uncharacterized protein n=1 Tax=Schizophyllum commune (strain H4-8 / FGSC 9210) TaxID=578458 RepID=UPI00215F33A6|nr:uncharacterized protein SCHCODRAFT_02711534 [Schizophyllum commune H4-8]KAI5900875.1 hypothetical protein SCHCODRAFT_02711534 [Schizophyllum commune H4-8]
MLCWRARRRHMRLSSISHGKADTRYGAGECAAVFQAMLGAGDQRRRARDHHRDMTTVENRLFGTLGHQTRLFERDETHVVFCDTLDSPASCSRSRLRSVSGSARLGGIGKGRGIFENGPRARERTGQLRRGDAILGSGPQDDSES